MADGLPDGFEDLLPFLDWSRPTELERNAKRWSATMDESQRFYDAMLARGAAALDYLGQFDLAEIDGENLVLLNMCLALTECSATVEMYEKPQPKYVFPIERFVPVHDAWSLSAAGDRP